MKPETRVRVEQIVLAALELEEQHRAEFLAQHCGEDQDLRREAEALLGFEKDAGTFLEAPALELAAEAFAKGHRSEHPPARESRGLEGKTISHYRVLSQLGSGGMGVVYEAVDVRLGRRVALKFLPENLAHDETALQRFEREARAASSLNHPGICTIHEVEEYGHQPVIVMELLEGQSLKERIREGPVPASEVLDFGIQISDALEAAHARGIIHRDIKPGNIFLVGNRRVKILDFGLAKVMTAAPAVEESEDSLTLEGVIPGTTPYMSPEQVRGEEIDTRSDLFSLGVVLYELATGQRPFARKNRILTTDAILNAKPPAVTRLNPALPVELDAIIARALEKDRGQRYQHASDMRIDLQQLKRDTDSGQVAVSERHPARPSAPRPWRFAGAAILVAAAVAAAGYFSLHRRSRLTDRDTIVLADFSNTTGDPVFDGALRQGLIVQLEQSPFLGLVSDQRIHQTLRLMNQPADARLTGQIAQEVCERTGSAAVLEGSISSLGTQYVLGLRANNCRTEETLDEEQAQAARKEDVLSALDHMASKFRSRAGESLATVEKYSTPLDEATTSSLEALKAYSTGVKVAFTSGYASGVPLLTRAVEIDPQFAMAYAHLGLWYSSIGESSLAIASTSKAYQLRDRVSERERFFIAAMYQRDVTGDLEAAHQTLELWANTYPRDVYAYGLLSGFISQGTGRYEQSIEEAKKALALDPEFTPGYINLAFSYFYLDRFSDAKSAVDPAFGRNLDVPENLMLRFYLAFLNGDEAGMAKAAAQAKGKPGAEDWMTDAQALVLARSGRLRAARQMSEQAVGLALQAGQRERAATYEAAEADWEALSGKSSAARKTAIKALNLSKGRDVNYAAAFALAVAGDFSQAKAIAHELETRFPKDSSVKFNYLPTIKGLLALQEGEPEGAIEVLQASLPNEFAVPPIDFNAFFGGLNPAWVRGQAYLAQNDSADAAAEFHKILNHKGLAAADPIGALAVLQLGKAYAIEGETEKAKSAYQDFFNTWKNADPEVPILKQAKAEYDRLQ